MANSEAINANKQVCVEEEKEKKNQQIWCNRRQYGKVEKTEFALRNLDVNFTSVPLLLCMALSLTWQVTNSLKTVFLSVKMDVLPCRVILC